MQCAEGVTHSPYFRLLSYIVSVHTPARLFGPRAALRLHVKWDAQPTSPHPSSSTPLLVSEMVYK